MIAYLGWMVASFLGGVLLVLLLQRRKPSLQRQVAQLEVFAGRTCDEILELMGEPQVTVQQADGQTLRTWRDRHYSVTLLFNARDMCLGVERECSRDT